MEIYILGATDCEGSPNDPAPLPILSYTIEIYVLVHEYGENLFFNIFQKQLNSDCM